MNRRDFIKGTIAGTVSGVLINHLGETKVVTPQKLYLEPISAKPLDKGVIDSIVPEYGPTVLHPWKIWQTLDAG